MWWVSGSHRTHLARDAPAEPVAASSPLGNPRSVLIRAVLPLAVQVAGTASEYLGEGISEELLNALSRTPGLEVIGRTSSFRFGNSTLGAAKSGGNSACAISSRATYAVPATSCASTWNWTTPSPAGSAWTARLAKRRNPVRRVRSSRSAGHMPARPRRRARLCKICRRMGPPLRGSHPSGGDLCGARRRGRCDGPARRSVPRPLRAHGRRLDGPVV